MYVGFLYHNTNIKNSELIAVAVVLFSQQLKVKAAKNFKTTKLQQGNNYLHQ
jgi:hypothetical protein